MMYLMTIEDDKTGAKKEVVKNVITTTNYNIKLF